MKRKSNSGLYSFLESKGVLTEGTKEDIEEAKKQYWLKVHREYKRKRYKEQKSYTVFFTNEEVKKILPKIDKDNGSVTNYIKQTALATINIKSVNDKKIIGKIHEALTLYYFTLKAICENNLIAEKIRNTILLEVDELEKNVMNLLK
jgi:phosphoribosyl-ATP pyrophosphohydrolase